MHIHPQNIGQTADRKCTLRKSFSQNRDRCVEKAINLCYGLDVE